MYGGRKRVGWAYLGRDCRIGGPVSSGVKGEGGVETAPTSLALPWPMGEGLSPMAFEVVG